MEQGWKSILEPIYIPHKNQAKAILFLISNFDILSLLPFILLQQHLDKLWLDTDQNQGYTSDAWNLVLSLIKSKS